MAVKKKKSEKKSYAAPEYMLTYGDMVTLLLTFFVIMISAGEVDPVELRLILSAFSGNLGTFKGGTTLSKGQLVEMGMSIESLPAKEKGVTLARSVKEAEEILKPELRAKQVRVREDERGLIISLSSDTFFRAGSADLEMDKAGELLRKVGRLVRDVPNKIRIEGHTDATPIDPNNPQYRSNWELSTARSMSVLNYLLAQPGGQDKEKDFEVAGFSEHRPVEKNDTPEQRAYNRRVDIVIMR
jgi:chemotaxis protein MotB